MSFCAELQCWQKSPCPAHSGAPRTSSLIGTEGIRKAQANVFFPENGVKSLMRAAADGQGETVPAYSPSSTFMQDTPDPHSYPVLEGKEESKGLFPTAQDNPMPQLSHAPQTVEAGTNGEKLVVIMVGLPGRGKTYIARKLAQYMSFFHGAPAEVFNVSNFRRQIAGPQPAGFFSPSNKQGLELRRKAAEMALGELKKFVSGATERVGRFAIFDGTNTTKKSREWVLQELSTVVQSQSHIIFLESIYQDETAVEARIVQDMPDYEGGCSDAAAKDFQDRVQHYLKDYQGLEERHQSWIKLIDIGRQVTANNIRGYLQTRVLQFAMCLQTSPRPIYLSRHGQSVYNEQAKIGGDSELSGAGQEYARKFAEFVQATVVEDKSNVKGCNPAHTRLWTSSLKRTIATAGLIPHPVDADGWVSMRPRVWRNLDELYAGPFDGMTYKEIENKAPEEFAARARNKLGYRYPRGESYLDVIARLEAVINELERQKDPVVIVGHQGVLRIVYTYLKGMNREEAPTVDIPLNTVIKLVPKTYGCNEQRFCLIPGDVATHAAPSH